MEVRSRLGNWHASSCPTNMEIGQWLPSNQDQNKEKQDLWTEAYACSLQHVVEAATGRSWMAEEEGMVPQISPLVSAFLAATRRHVCPCAICKCWPPEHSIIPKEPMDEICTTMVQRLDETTQRGMCLHTQTLIKVIGRRTVCPTPLE